jgi:hypothetical protein
MHAGRHGDDVISTHMRPSSDEVAIMGSISSRCMKFTQVTGSVWAGMVLITRPCATSQIRTVSSAEPLTCVYGNGVKRCYWGGGSWQWLNP